MAQPAGFDALERLGGSRATVHRAVQRRTGRIVVLKHAGWDRPAVAAGLGREAHVLGRVAHPSLIQLLDCVDDEVGRTLVLPHAPGGDLGQRLAQDGHLAAAEAADLGSRLAGALAALHQAGIVHRDVHPGNVLIDAELVPMLADLDHATAPDDGPLEVDTQVVGAADHLDPRLLQGSASGPAGDLYGLGSTVWAAATGGAPRPAAPSASLPTQPPLPTRLHATITACLTGSIGSATAAEVAFHAAALEAAVWVAPDTAPDTATSPAPLRSLPAPAAPDPSDPDPSRAGSSPGTGTSQVPLAAMPPPTRTAAFAGGGAGLARPTTRRWGPTPPPPRSTVVTDPVKRTGWLFAALALAALPVVIILTVRGGRPATVDAGRPQAVLAPPACDGATIDVGDVPADVDGSGCSLPLRLEDGLLTLPTGTYAIGEDGDMLIAGDWNGDGRWTPGLYRPATGDVFLFDSVPEGDELTSRPATRTTRDGQPIVVAGPNGHRVEVILPAP